jgi:hypothetical protein
MKSSTSNWLFMQARLFLDIHHAAPHFKVFWHWGSSGPGWRWQLWIWNRWPWYASSDSHNEAWLMGSLITEFVEDDEIADDRMSQLYRWRDLEDNLCSEGLENIAQAYKYWDQCSHTSEYINAYDSSDGFIHLLPREKDMVWSVRVKVCQVHSTQAVFLWTEPK